jgi:tripartite-type tricarboxylate transporter receptor subunit TctC
MMASPNTPAEYVKTLRATFIKAVNDPELLVEAKKKTMDVELITGEKTEALAKDVVNQPPEIVARLNKLLGE